MRQHDRMVMGWSSRRMLLVLDEVLVAANSEDRTAFVPRMEVRATSSNGGDATSTAEEIGMSVPQWTNKICVYVYVPYIMYRMSNKEQQ